jgi:hypothetical protein
VRDLRLDLEEEATAARSIIDQALGILMSQ